MGSCFANFSCSSFVYFLYLGCYSFSNTLVCGWVWCPLRREQSHLICRSVFWQFFLDHSGSPPSRNSQTSSSKAGNTQNKACFSGLPITLRSLSFILRCQHDFQLPGHAPDKDGHRAATARSPSSGVWSLELVELEGTRAKKGSKQRNSLRYAMVNILIKKI